MPIDVVPVKLKGRKAGRGKFKYIIIQKDVAPVRESFPKHMLADTAEEAEAVFKTFSKTINDLARSYAASSGLNRADLFGEAIVGLARARRDFDPRRSKNFKTFAIFKMKDTLNDYVRSFVGPVAVPAYIRRISRWVKTMEDVLRSAALAEGEIEAILNGEKEALLPDESMQDQIIDVSSYLEKEAKRLNVPLKELVKRARSLPRACVVETDTIADSSDQRLQAGIMVEELKKHLNKNELRIADMIMEGRTYREIAEEFGRTPAWVSQQLKKIKERLGDKFEL